MTCKDCVHYELCFDYTHLKHSKNLPDNRENVCEHFKNKANFVEVKQGEWIYWQPDGLNHLWNCSVCNNSISTPMKFVADHIKYCEHCGAKMDGERKCDK